MKALATEADPVRRFRLWGNLAACHWGAGEHTAAEDAIEAAAELLDEIADDRLLGNHFNNLGLVCWSTGRLDAALIHYEGALYHYELTRERHLEASVLNNIGCVLTGLKRYGDALGYLRRAQATYEACGEGFDVQLAEVHKSQTETLLARAAVAGGEGE